MNNGEVTIWGTHAGKTGDAETLFLEKEYVAVGWPKVGNPGELRADREAFKAKMAEAYPEIKPKGIPLSAGELFRFVYEMKLGDLVVFYLKRDGKVYIGEVKGPYIYDPILEAGYPNLRSVKWLHSLPYTDFTPGARQEIKATLSLFQVKNHADEFRAALENKIVLQPVVNDKTVAIVALDIEETTKHPPKEQPELSEQRQRVEDEGYFDTASIEDERQRIYTSIVQRQGQAKFRRKLLEAYDCKCVITGCDAEPALEASHIFPYKGEKTNNIANGLLLRADIHTLFDLHLLSIQPETYKIVLAPELIATAYKEFAEQKLYLPKNEIFKPDRDALTRHYELFMQKNHLNG